jgi:uncharacterized membrane protein YdbT with pleckstrin-like domain
MNTEPVKKPQDRMIQERPAGVYARSMLREGETLVRQAQIHYGIFWKGVALFVISALLMIKIFNLGAFLMFVSLLMLSVAYLTRYYLLLALTDRRVLIRSGIINLDTVEIQLSRVESVELARTIIGRILGYATVLITGTGSRRIAVPFIGDAETFRAEFHGLLDAREGAGK